MRRNNEFLYQKLYGIIKEQIVSGFIRPGDYLLPESELCKLHSMSRNSVRKALDELQKDGLVIKRAGLGTMVPEDLSFEQSAEPILRIMAPSPAFFVDYGLQRIIEAFTKEHPGVSVKILRLPEDRFWGSYQQSLDIGVTTDLVFVSDHYMEEVEDIHQFVDLREPIGDSLDLVYERVLRRFTKDEQVKAAPLTFTPTFLVYNPTLFYNNNVPLPTPDWTTEQFLEACHSLTIPENKQVGISLIPSFRRWPIFALQSGLQEDLKPLNKQNLSKALHLLETILFKQRTAVKYHRMESNPFLYEKSAMTLATTFELSSWVEAELSFTPQIAPLPFGHKKSTLLQGNALMMPVSCGNLSLAYSFIRTALSGDVQSAMTQQTPFLSINQQINENVKGVELLQAMNVEYSMMNDNYFLHDLFPELISSDNNTELDLFWMGLASVESTVEALLANHTAV